MNETTSSHIKQFLPRIDALLFIILFLSTLTLGPQMLNIDGDLPRHLLMGKVVLETGTPPTQEIFSYPYENRSYIPHEWLAGVVYYLMFFILGLNGVVLLAGMLIAATFGVIYSEALRNNAGKAVTFLLLMLGAIVTSIHWVARPHLFTMLFFAIWLLLTDRVNRGVQVKIWFFPALMLLWANVHAEFISGFLVLFAYLGGWLWQYLFTRSKPSFDKARNLVAVTFLSLAASLLNPAGLRIWDTVLGYLNNSYLMSRIVETRPPDFAQAEYWPLMLLMGISVILLIIKRDQLTPAHFFLIAGFGVMSLVSARNSHLFGVAAPFVLCMSMQKTKLIWPLNIIEERIARVESQLNGYILPIALTVLVSTLVITFPLRDFNRFEPTVFPVDAVQWLSGHPQSGRMFNAFDWGGYILFHLWPEQKVFIESQTDTSGEVTQKYETVIMPGNGWQNIFNEYDITWVLIPSGWDLTLELKTQGWEAAYQDPTAIILVKR